MGNQLQSLLIKAHLLKRRVRRLAEFNPADHPRNLAGTDKGGEFQSAGQSSKPTVFYKGHNPDAEPGQRIKTGDDFWDSLTFVSSKRDSAAMYGRNVETVLAKPNAKIVYEGTREFRSVMKGITIKNKSLLVWASETAKRAKASGYDAVHYSRQGDVGTAIINPGMFTRNVTTLNK